MILCNLLRRRGAFNSALIKRSITTTGTGDISKPQFPIWKSLGLFLATGTGLLLYYRREKEKHFLAKKGVEAKAEIGNPLVGGSFELIDCEGKPFSDKDLLGKYYLLYFGFTHCPDICPEELAKISEVIDLIKKQLPEAPIVPVFITCDPERDTPSVIKSYLQDFGNEFLGLTGAPEVIKEVAKKFRIYYRPTQTSGNGDYLVDHSIFYYLMGPDGKFVTNFGRNTTSQECAEAVLVELSKANYLK